MTTLSLHFELLDSLHPHPTTRREIATVTALVGRYATDMDDERELLGMLGVAS